MVDDTIRHMMRRLEITTRRLLNGSQAGEARSRCKGTGFAFDQIREYHQGDDIRFIDWHATARHERVLVKEYMEERNRTIMLLVDCSASRCFTSGDQSIAQLSAEVAAVLALVANYGGDKSSLMLFSDTVEQYIPPARGRNHARAIMEALFTINPAGKSTDMREALTQVIKQRRRDGVLCIISDCIDQTYDEVLAQRLRTAARMYDTMVIRCSDPLFYALPSVGFLPIIDPETGEQGVLDVRSRQHKAACALQECEQSIDTLCKRTGIDLVTLSNERPFLGDLIRFFRRRMRY